MPEHSLRQPPLARRRPSRQFHCDNPIGDELANTAEHREPCDSSYAAFIAAHSIIAAPIARHRGGFGQHIEVALFDAAFQVMGREAQIVNGVPAACERLPINRAIIKRDRCGATTGCSAPAPRFGTLALAVGALRLVPSRRRT